MSKEREEIKEAGWLWFFALMLWIMMLVGCTTVESNGPMTWEKACRESGGIVLKDHMDDPTCVSKESVQEGLRRAGYGK